MQNFIATHIRCDVSDMVRTLAADWNVDYVNEGMDELHAQAQELVALRDYEAAARAEGWTEDDHEISRPDPDSDDEDAREYADDWKDACEACGAEPEGVPAIEHHAISTWLADKLESKGERIERDFAGLIVWARTKPQDDHEAAARAEGWLPDLSGPHPGEVYKHDHGETHTAASWAEACKLEGIEFDDEHPLAADPILNAIFQEA